MRTIYLYFLGIGLLLLTTQLSAQCNFLEPGLGINACQNAPLLDCQTDLNEICGFTFASGSSGLASDIFCGSTENDQWFAFIAYTTLLSIKIETSNCVGTPNGSGLQAQIFKSDDCLNFEAVSNCASPGAVGNLNLTTNVPLIPGQIYYLMIDGWAGDFCEFEIVLVEGTNCECILPENTPCQEDISQFVFANTSPDSCPPTWVLDQPFGEIISGQGTNNIQVAWTGGGLTNLCVELDSSCSIQDLCCIEIFVNPSDTSIVNMEICPGIPIEFLGVSYEEAGNYVLDISSSDGCDSTVLLNITAFPEPVLIDEGNITLCSPEIYDFHGEILNETGFYTLNPSGNCDTVYQINFVALDTDPMILQTQQFPCEFSSSIGILDGSSTSFTVPTGASTGYAWVGPGIISDPNQVSIEIDQAGIYSLTAIAEYQGLICINTINFEVLAPPPIMINVEASICEGESINFEGQTYSQSGNYPVTFVTDEGCDSIRVLNLEVTETVTTASDAFACFGGFVKWFGMIYDQAGTYMHLEPIPGTNCSDTFLLDLMISDPISLGSTIIEPDNGSGNGSISPSITGGVPPYTYAWSNGEMTLNISNLEAGPYTLSIVDNLGCEMIFDFNVEQINGINSILKSTAFSISPNPVNSGELTLIHTENHYQAILNFQIFAINGQEIYTDFSIIENKNISIKAPNVAGVYLIKLKTDSGNWIGKLVVQ